jgi:4-hydroxythreonine-4-phosphate dehydrogenase
MPRPPPRPHDRPWIALSIGDPCGIGPEIALRLVTEEALPARILLLGDRRALERDAGLVPAARARFGERLERLTTARDGRAGASLPDDVDVALDAVADEAGRERMPGTLPPVGAADARAGAACHAWVLRGADLAASGRVAALATGPIHKGAWGLAGIEDPGHTEALARKARARRVVMAMVGGGLRVALSTIHVALRDVPGMLTVEGIAADLEVVDRGLRDLYGVPLPRIGVCGLNPHAGEGGRFGNEEERVIAPAVALARSRGVDATGPLPADACLPAAAAGGYDAALAMYHDQGLAAVKVLAPRACVNVTLGLPFVRTSVDHGTAFDRAGKGTATASSLRAAVEAALECASRRAERFSKASRAQ